MTAVKCPTKYQTKQALKSGNYQLSAGVARVNVTDITEGIKQVDKDKLGTNSGRVYKAPNNPTNVSRNA